MKLLFDQNLAPALARRLSDLFPGSAHVMDLGLHEALDREVWECAKRNDYVLVSKDADFSELGLLEGFPPKVLWIRRGNCSTRAIEELLRAEAAAVRLLENDPEVGTLELF